jgi:branched-chain amino acid transport system substrate-binding protein
MRFKPGTHYALLFLLTSSLAVAGEPIRIGATMSESGHLSTQGRAAANGYRLCEQHVNADGGLLGREIRFEILDDESDSDTAIALYEQLIVDDEVDAIMGPYGSTLTEAVAPVTERHHMVHISPLAATTSIWEQGREYLFMVLPPAELFLAGLIDLADQHGLERVAILTEDALFPRAAGSGAESLARERGMEVVFHEAYSTGSDDFTTWLERLDDHNIEVLAMAASSLGDFITIVEQMKAADIRIEMFGTSGAVSQFAESLGSAADFSYGLSAWEPTLDNPGIERFVTDYQARFEMAPSFHAAGAYGSCQLFAKAVEHTGSLESDKLRQALLELETTTVFGPYAVDERGYQVANQGLTIQWQHGEKAIVWPSDKAQTQPWHPTPSWSLHASELPPQQQVFWTRLERLCGKAFAGRVSDVTPFYSGVAEAESLIMHVLDCSEDRLHIPLHVDDNRSRNWILTQVDGSLRLKHDHRYPDGREEAISQYGGDAPVPGLASRQIFPADEHTAEILPERDDNFWFMDFVDEHTLQYGVHWPRKGHSIRLEFDLSVPVQTPPRPWGYEN